MGSFGLKAFALGMNDEISTLGQLALGIGAADPTGMFPANGAPPTPNAAMQPVAPQPMAPPVMQPAAGWGQPAAPAPAPQQAPAPAQGYSPPVGTAPEQAAPAGAPSGPAAMFASLEEKYGLPKGTLMHLYGIESGYGADLVNESSSARGPFQFIRSTAAQYGLDDRSVMDLGASAEAAARLAADNMAVLRNRTGRDPTIGEIYLAHQQGAGGADKLMGADPNGRAVDLVGRDAVLLNGGNAGMTVGEFRDMWLNKQPGQPTMSARDDLGPEGPHYGTEEDYEDLKEEEEDDDLNLTAGERWGVAFSGLGKGLGQISKGQPVDIGDVLEKHRRRQEEARGRLSEVMKARIRQREREEDQRIRRDERDEDYRRQQATEGRADARTQAAEERQLERDIAEEERQLGRTLSAEEREDIRLIAQEERALGRALSAEEREDFRKIAAEERAQGRTLSAEERAEIRDIAGEGRAVEQAIAAEERELGRTLNAEERAQVAAIAGEDRAVAIAIATEQRQLGRDLNEEERNEVRDIAREERDLGRKLSEEERAEMRTVSAENRAADRLIATEERQLGRKLSEEEREEVRAIAAENRAVEIAIAAEERELGRDLSDEERENVRILASEDRAVERAIAAEERQQGRTLSAEEREEFRTRASEDRATARMIDAEQRQLGRDLSEEEREAVRILATEERAIERTIAEEERALGRTLNTEERAEIRLLAQEQRQLGRDLNEEDRAAVRELAKEGRNPSSLEEKLAAIMSLGYDRGRSIEIALLTDVNENGQVVRLDTGEVLLGPDAIGAGGAPATTGGATVPTGGEVPAVDVSPTTGLGGAVTNTANTIVGFLGGGTPFPAQQEAEKHLAALQNRTLTSLISPLADGHVSDADKNRVEDLMSKWYHGSGETKDSFVALREMVQSEVSNLQRDVFDNPQAWATAPEVRQKARLRINDLNNLATDFTAVINGFEARDRINSGDINVEDFLEGN